VYRSGGFSPVKGDAISSSAYRKIQQLLFCPALIPHIETVSGVELAADLIASDFVGALFVGSYDFSLSLVQPGNFNILEFKNAISQLKLICHESTKPLDIQQVAPNINELKARREGHHEGSGKLSSSQRLWQLNILSLV